jgi:hypothetical protein
MYNSYCSHTISLTIITSYCCTLTLQFVWFLLSFWNVIEYFNVNVTFSNAWC